jgi:hypothetical protein
VLRFALVALAVGALGLAGACAAGGNDSEVGCGASCGDARAGQDGTVDGAGDAASPTGHDGGADAAPNPGSDATAVDGGSFTPPSDMRDRLGIYAWGFDTTSWPGTPDRLNWGAGKVAALGARTIRVYLGPQDIYHVLPSSDGGAFDLATAAASPAYSTLFANPDFDTYLLTTYSAEDNESNWTTGYDAGAGATEEGEIASLGEYLLMTYPQKTFIILQWEGDNAISSVASSQSAWDGFTAWIGARAQGVVDARAAVKNTTAKLYSGVEFNLLRNLSTGAPCDTSVNKCVVSVVVPAVNVDYYSYSSWQSVGPNQTPAQVTATLQADLTTALGWAQKHDPSATPARFIVGEFGAPREQTDLGECASTARTAAVLAAIPHWGASYGIYWQIIDNVPSGQPNDFVDGFGIFKANGTPSLAAGLFQTLYQTQVPTAPTAPSCPLINQGGVVNSADSKTTDITSTSIISIYGQSFTDGGDVVRVREATEEWDIDGGPNFYESSGQINATLPGVGAGQNALVFVTDGDGIDSNGQIIPIQP